MQHDEFTYFALAYIEELRLEGRHSTAHVYENAVRSFTRFCGTPSVSFRQFTRCNLKKYNLYLCQRGRKANTVSTYMRMLRSLYNRGVDLGVAPYVPRLFREVFTGVEVLHKKALAVEDLHALLHSEVEDEELRRIQAIANLLFQLCGMSFADFAHLEKKDVEGGILRYRRVKTDTPVSVELLDTARQIIAGLRREGEPRPGLPDYLFPILSGLYRRCDAAGYREYQSALRRFNAGLQKLARACHVCSKVTSYCLRHSWATIAKYRGVPIEMISESLGHKSIKTTQIYLRAFDMEKRTTVNRMNISYVKNCKARITSGANI